MRGLKMRKRVYVICLGLTSFFTPLIDIINSYRGDVRG